jgi:glycosyltransferase involved in cell wall biosynthesis
MKLFLALLASEVICISNYTAATLPQKLLPSIRIITNPFETRFATTDRDEAKANIIRHLGLAWDTRLVGFFGNLVEQKRPAVFLRAAAKIVEQYNGQIAFVLCGAERNNARAELTQLADELGIGHQIHLVGFQAPVEPWIAGCDMIIAPGVGEGLGRSLIEAMIVGTPVVAANSGGHSEVISNENTGLLATVDDPNAFAVAACRLLKQDDLARAIAERAQAEAVANHSIEQHVRAVTGIYLERRETPSRNTGERK